MGLLAFVVCTQSCKKNDSPKTDTPTTKTIYISSAITIFMGSTYNTSYTYDSKKRMASSTQNDAGGKTVILYGYDDNNRLISLDFSQTQTTGLYRTLTEYTYDDTKSIVHAATTKYANTTVTATSATDYLFDGNRVKEVHTDSGIVTINTYDANGNNIKTEVNDGTVITNTFTDKKVVGKPIQYPSINNYVSPNLVAGSVTTVPNSPDQVTNYTYTFDSDGRVVTETQVRPNDTQNNITVTNAYDEDGYVTATSYVYPNSPTATTKYAYTYIEL